MDFPYIHSYLQEMVAVFGLGIDGRFRRVREASGKSPLRANVS